jgi:hypothetical protein
MRLVNRETLLRYLRAMLHLVTPAEAGPIVLTPGRFRKLGLEKIPKISIALLTWLQPSLHHVTHDRGHGWQQLGMLAG